MGRLDGKVALVTGTARGTGAEIQRLFVEEGARVMGVDVLDELGEAVAAPLGDAAAYQHVDVRDPSDWSAAVAATVARFGPVDVLVNNAAVLEVASFEEHSHDRFRDVIDVNLVGPFLGMQAVLPGMAERGAGSIVNVGSIDSLEGEVGITAYGASKWGLRGLTKCAALELGRQGVRVNLVAAAPGSDDMSKPFFEATTAKLKAFMAAGGKAELGSPPVQPMGRGVGTTRHVAHMCAFLASDDAGYCNGGDYAVDGGFTAGHIFPGSPGTYGP